MRLALDTEDTVRSFDPECQRPAKGHSIRLAFLGESPEAVDATYEQLVAAGYAGHLVEHLLGPALRQGQRPGRQPYRPVRALHVSQAAQPLRSG